MNRDCFELIEVQAGECAGGPDLFAEANAQLARAETIAIAIGTEKDYLDRAVHFDLTRRQQQHEVRRGRSQAGFDIHRFLLYPPMVQAALFHVALQERLL